MSPSRLSLLSSLALSPVYSNRGIVFVLGKQCKSLTPFSLDSGAIDTPMHQANLERISGFAPAPSTAIPRDGKAQEVADVTVFLLSEKSAFVTGAAWSVDGGANI